MNIPQWFGGILCCIQLPCWICHAMPQPTCSSNPVRFPGNSWRSGSHMNASAIGCLAQTRWKTGPKPMHNGRGVVFFGQPLQPGHNYHEPTKFNKSMDWFKGKFTGKPYIYWQNPWFPADFPLNQSIEQRFSHCFSNNAVHWYTRQMAIVWSGKWWFTDLEVPYSQTNHDKPWQTRIVYWW